MMTVTPTEQRMMIFLTDAAILNYRIKIPKGVIKKKSE
ncbi:MAG: hypothetical protein PWQ51_930 [Methanolobus sp.]|jgi:hypothetical protein|nr:hypothetical protein [Methanolobus sp.]